MAVTRSLLLSVLGFIYVPTVNFALSTTNNGRSIITAWCSNGGFVFVNSAGQTPRKVRQQNMEELVDVYCSQCNKKVNLLNDLEARLKNLKANR